MTCSSTVIVKLVPGAKGRLGNRLPVPVPKSPVHVIEPAICESGVTDAVMY